MIFVTTGAQLPFDRFVRMIDGLAGCIEEKVVAQFIPDKYHSRNLELTGFISPATFGKYVSDARIVVAHAGMGSIISALEVEKPVIVLPRQASLGEHRNDHQVATAERMSELGYVLYAHDYDEMKTFILAENLPPLRKISKQASASLIQAIINEI